MKNLTTLDYWTNAFKDQKIELTNDDVIKQWVLKYLRFSDRESCIEIGCYPGRYLTILGDYGVELNGIDFIKNVTKLPVIFAKYGYNVGEFVCEDFINNSLCRKFDYVMSFGFIEHFDQWEIIIEKHCNLVNDHGYLIIEAPNFSGYFQKIPRFIFDYDDLKRHNLKSMDLEKWTRILERNGFEIITAEYFGEYNLWFDKKITNKYILFFKKIIIFLLNKTKNKVYPNTKDHKSFSSYFGVIAKRK
jgi:2-polyprenyl-3-methyl-5-hydroxy-6-metoxy-1,4-benzoquinol methylase